MERIYVIPLRKVKEAPRTVRAPKAVRVVKEFLQKHMKSEEIKLDASVKSSGKEEFKKFPQK